MSKMLKHLLLFVTVLAVFVRANPEAKPEDDDEDFQGFAEKFKTDVIDKKGLTCETYETYCDGEGKDEFEDEASCKIWTGNYLCKQATDAEGIKNTLDEITSHLSEAPAS